MMTRKTAVQMKHRTFSGKGPVPIFDFVLDCKAVCDACNIYDGAAMWLLKHCLTHPVEAVIKAQVALLTDTDKS